MAPAERLKLPTGTQSLQDIRDRNCYYVDKTEYALRMAADDKFLFLTRPRRFGKTLFLDTLAELYAGRERLFRGLAAHGRWDWSKRHPVVRLNFAAGNYKAADGLTASIASQIWEAEREYAVDAVFDTPPERFSHLIRRIRERAKERVVVLIDEYDKPILDAIEDKAAACANRDALRGLYGAIKACDAHIEKCFVTGICRFPRTSLFSTANQFTDLTFDPNYNAACGFTDDELDRVFAPELAGLDRDRVRRCYNGYSWTGDGGDTVYSPYDAMLLFRSRAFDDHWWETGTPAFLVEHMSRHGILDIGDLDGGWVAWNRLSNFDIERMDAAALMFQTGNLTLRKKETRHGRPGFRLAYPNDEVRHCMGWLMTLQVVGDEDRAASYGDDLRAAVETADMGLLERTMRGLYASLPHQQLESVGRYEALYALAVRALAMGAGIESRSEESGALGRADLTLLGGGNVFLFEFKLQGRGDPLAQARERDYAGKYRRFGSAARLVGVTIDPGKRAIEPLRSARPFRDRRREPDIEK